MLGILTAVAIVVSAIESTLPAIPFLPPGAKAGFSNIITMFAVISMPLPYSLAIAAGKGIFTLCVRGAVAGGMSLAGGILSVVVIYILMHIKSISYSMLGVCGAVSHNIAQLAVAFLVTGRAAVYYLPALIIFGIISGLLTSALLRAVLPLMNKLFTL